MERIKVLENQQEYFMVKLNQTLSDNKKFRTQIDQLRRQKKLTNISYTVMEKQVKSMANLADDTNKKQTRT
jgi:hypothetical protein